MKIHFLGRKKPRCFSEMGSCAISITRSISSHRRRRSAKSLVRRR